MVLTHGRTEISKELNRNPAIVLNTSGNLQYDKVDASNLY